MLVSSSLLNRIDQQNLFVNIGPGVTNSVDDVIENAYQYGRTGIGTYVDELLKDADADQRKHLKDQLLSVWDRLIQYWLDRKKDNTFNGPQVPASAISDSIGEIVNNEGIHPHTHPSTISIVFSASSYSFDFTFINTFVIHHFIRTNTFFFFFC